jgi:hypothetical protein
MDWNFSEIFTPPPIMGVTINSVSLPPEVRQFLYGLIALLLACGTIYYLVNNLRFHAALRKSVILAFFVAGFFYALHADIGWSTWVIHDSRNLAGMNTDAKLEKLEGGIYDFAQKARTILGTEYMLFTSDAYLGLRAEYFLLPLRKREQANDIVVLADTLARYDQATRTFTRENIKITDVEPIFVFAQNAYILRKRR